MVRVRGARDPLAMGERPRKAVVQTEERAALRQLAPSVRQMEAY